MEGQHYTAFLQGEKWPIAQSTYCGLKLLEHKIKVWENILEDIPKKVVKISDNQFGF